jgi:hypothetical protein
MTVELSTVLRVWQAEHKPIAALMDLTEIRLDSTQAAIHDLFFARSSRVEICCACQQLTCAILARATLRTKRMTFGPDTSYRPDTTTIRHLWRGQRTRCRTYTLHIYRAASGRRLGSKTVFADGPAHSLASTTTARSLSAIKDNAAR